MTDYLANTPHVRSDSRGDPFSVTGKGHTLTPLGTALIAFGAVLVLAGTFLWWQQ